MKKTIFLLLASFLLIQCSSTPRPVSVISGAPGGTDDPLLHKPGVTENWAYYSHGLNLKREALEIRGNPEKNRQLNRAIEYFRVAEKDRTGLEYIYNQISDCYYHLYNFTSAIEYAEKSIGIKPEFMAPYSRLYEIYMRLRNNAKAADVLQRYLVVKPKALQIRYILARNYYIRMKKTARAEEEFKKLIAVAATAQNGVYYLEYGNYYLGDIAYRRGQNKEALAYYEKTVLYNRKNNYAHFRLAILYIDAMKYDQAVEHASLYLEAYPKNRNMNGVIGRSRYINEEYGAVTHLRKGTSKNLNGIVARGLLLDMRGQDSSAEKLLRFAVKRNPSYVSAHIALASILRRKNKSKEAFNEYVSAGIFAFRNENYTLARRMFTKALSIDNAVLEARYYMGRTCEEEGNRAMAIHYYMKVNDEKPNSDLMLHIGYLFGQDGNYPRAFYYFDKVALKEPENSRPWFFKGIFSIRDKKYDEAEKNIKKAIVLDSSKDTYYFYLAIALEKSKKIDEAIKNLERALEKNPGSSKINNYLGYLYADNNIKLERSLFLINRALSVEPENGAYMDSLGWAYFRQGKYNLALKKLLEAEKKLDESKSPDAVVYDHIGDAYLKHSKTDKALEYWEKSLKLKEEKKVREKINNLNRK